MNENYYYGQGKVFLAKRNNSPVFIWRWIGDVSSLNISLTFDQKQSKSSCNGRLSVNKRYITELGGTIESIWHSLSVENLSLLTGSASNTANPGVVESFELPVGIKSGDRISLPHQGVWAIAITGLTEDIDYQVDDEWGVIEFILTPEAHTFYVTYKHSGSESLPIFTEPYNEYALRYEGINLAEDGAPTLVEFYRLSIDPATVFNLINNSNDIAGVVTNALILPDMKKMQDPLLGRFGRFVIIPKSDSTYGMLTPIYTTASTSGEIVTIYPK